MDIGWNDDAMVELARQAGEQVAGALQSAVDQVASEYRGRPVEDIKPALAAAWAGVAGGSITDPELTEWAERIRTGQHIEIGVGEPQA